MQEIFSNPFFAWSSPEWKKNFYSYKPLKNPGSVLDRLKLTFGVRLILGFCVTIFFRVTIGIIGIVAMKKMNDKLNAVVSFNVAKIDYASAMTVAVARSEAEMLNLFLSASVAEQKKITDKLK